MVVVIFNKKLSGNLNGLEITDKISFPSRKEANTWIRDVTNLDHDDSYSNFRVEEKAA